MPCQKPQPLTRTIFSLAIPTSLALAVGADLWIWLIFGQVFGPAAPALRILAPMFVLTYVLLDRGWTAIIISLCGLAVTPLLNPAQIGITS